VTAIVPNLVAGTWIRSGNAVPDINPSDTSDIVGRYAAGDASTVDAAVAAAREAFAGWASASPQVRFDVLDRVGDEILRRREEFGELLAREEGKTRAESIGEATRAPASSTPR
jgi:acyl-CoA reductase-like NAD-dependent aldehyde dehydrogenase